MNRSIEFRSFLPGLYPVAALLVIVPILDLVGVGWPPHPSEAAWRFGSLGLGFSALILQILGIALALAIACLLSHHRVLRVLALLSLAAATMMIAGLARFLLDYGQLRAAIPAAERAGFDASTFRALVSATLGIPVLFALGARALAHSRPDAADGPTDQRAERPVSVIPFRHRQPN